MVFDRLKHGIRQISGSPERSGFIPGIEGSGKVIASGGGLLPSLWMDKRVACSSTGSYGGTWAEYMAVPAVHCIPLPKSIDDEQGSMLVVNPLTAIAFIRIAKNYRCTTIINTAAASSLGRMIEWLAKRSGITVINIVRNNGQQEELLGKGSGHVLNSNDEDFVNDLNRISHKLNATLVFDAVGGTLTRELMLNVPDNSQIIIYGNLSGMAPEIDHRSLVVHGKKVSGFFLGSWLQKGSGLNLLRSIINARSLLKNGIEVPVQGRFSLTQVQEAVDTYLTGMTRGKVLLVP